MATVAPLAGPKASECLDAQDLPDAPTVAPADQSYWRDELARPTQAELSCLPAEPKGCSRWDESLWFCKMHRRHPEQADVPQWELKKPM